MNLQTDETTKYNFDKRMKDVTHNTNNTLGPKDNPRASGFTIPRRILNKKGHRQFHTKILPENWNFGAYKHLWTILKSESNQYREREEKI